ncbi:MAG: FecR domain-containing protein [Acidobacteria bacterium]|nr:FecR domain-containing protein [Acidobacteriota bacterium]MBS1864387.1 FecR domain-containing protein [Acidobacteriota bacterium]
MNCNSVKAFRQIPFLLILGFLICATTAKADSSHARIIRLSYVQGDVRIAHDISGDPLQAGDTAWERAALNMPVHQSDVVATDNGRAEVEFESGNVAFLAENTVLQFYDLSLEDGSFTTRLILRQGSASFYVRPARGDYFSVTGGDFSIEATEKSEFRLNNYDDGSDVQVLQGRIAVLSKDKTTRVSKGQSLSMKADDPISLSVDKLGNTDDFDQWVNGKIESGQAATTASQQYSGVYNYDSGFGDLYTYGGWYPISGYGYCWRPYGVSFGWNPFQMGQWYFDPSLGNWVFIGSQPWGWLPYHYGSWVFHAGLGWVWTPTGSFPHVRGGSFAMARGGQWRPVTGTWVKSGGSVGLVPTHPLDERGKSPINLQQGVFPISQRGVLDPVQASAAENWKNLHKGPARGSLPTETANTSAPSRVVRMMSAGGSATGVTARNQETGITFDPAEHRFVNNSVVRSTEREAMDRSNGGVVGGKPIEPGNTAAKNSDMRRGTEMPGGQSAAARGPMPPSARTSVATPPPANSAGRGGNAASGGGSRWGGNSSNSSGGSSRGWSGSSSSSSSSSASSSRSSGASTSSRSSSGGRPH